MKSRLPPLGPLFCVTLVAGLLCGAATLEAQLLTGIDRGWGNSWEYGGSVSWKGTCDDGFDNVPCPEEPDPLSEIEEESPKKSSLFPKKLREDFGARLAAEVKDEAEKRADADNSLMAAGAWAYYRDGKMRSDQGVTVATHRWACKILKGRACFLGLLAGKATAGAALGVGARPIGAKGYQLVLFVGLAAPYASDGKDRGFYPLIGGALKF